MSPEPLPNMAPRGSSARFYLVFICVSGARAAGLPHFRAENGTEQLLVQGCTPPLQ